MRLKLLMRRLTVSSPRMAVRSALPWPVRWVVLAMVAGFCAAVAVWAFEFGKDIAGLDKGNKAQLQQARLEVQALRAQLDLMSVERDQAQSVANTADTVLTAEKVAQEQLLALNKQLEIDNQRLKDELGFFEKLIPSRDADATGMAIRALQAEVVKPGEIKWQVLVIQGVKSPVEFNGRLELVFVGSQGSKPWSSAPSAVSQSVKVKQYARVEGVFSVPPEVAVKSVTAKVFVGQVLRAVQTVKLP